MSGQLTPSEHRLFDAACSGQLSEADRESLQALLRGSSAARRRYLDYTALHADLFGAVRAARVRERFAAALDAEADAVASPISAGQGRRVATIMTFALATAAAILLMFAVRTDAPVGKVAVNTDDQIETEQPEAELDPAARWPGLVARVNRVESARWGVDRRAFVEADFLAAGQAVALESGLVEIEFRQGAVVLLEGPAELIAENANAATLLRGKLAAVAPPWATGFRVDTPGVDVVDHGTEFAVSVSGDGADAKVNVVVTEGEVEVLADKQAEGGRRLLAGEGVQATGSSVQDGDDAAARELTEKLPDRPEFKNAVVVGDRWADWLPGVSGEPRRDGPWRHYTNSASEFGQPSGYEEMVWDTETKSYRPIDCREKPWLNKFVRAHRDGGHPGKGRDQVGNEIDRYSITGFVVPEDGVYRLEAGWLERLWAKRWDQDRVLDIAVHVNDNPVVMRQFCDRNCFVDFNGSLGELAAGDVIYVGVGPNGLDFNDKFRWGFYVVRETGNRTDEGELAALD